MTTALSAPTTSAIDPAAAIPVADWGNLVLRAGRFGPILPHMAWLLRFPDEISRDALEQEARRLAATPYGFGRRIAPRRLPGGGPRWLAARALPPVVLAETAATGPSGLAAWLDRQLAIPLDPEHDAGWRLAATPTDDGGTAVLVACHHLFGTGPGILARSTAMAATRPSARPRRPSRARAASASGTRREALASASDSACAARHNCPASCRRRSARGAAPRHRTPRRR